MERSLERRKRLAERERQRLGMKKKKNPAPRKKASHPKTVSPPSPKVPQTPDLSPPETPAPPTSSREERQFTDRTETWTTAADGSRIRTVTVVTTTVVTETQTSVTVEPLEPSEPLRPRSHPQPPMIPPQEHASLPSMPSMPLSPFSPSLPSGIVSSQGIVSSLFRDSRASRQVVLHAGKRNTMTVVRLSGKLKKSCLVFAQQVQPGVDKMVPIKPLKNATVGDRNVGAHRVHVEFVKELFIHRVPPERKTQEVVQALRLLVNHPCNFSIRTQAENLQERRWENHILRMTRPQPPALEELPWRKAEFVQKLRDIEDGLEGMRHVAVQANQPVVLWCLQLLENVLTPLFHFHEEERKQAVGAELAQSQSPV